jgi:hypothetical protein
MLRHAFGESRAAQASTGDGQIVVCGHASSPVQNCFWLPGLV